MLNDTLPSVFNSIALEKQASKKVIWALLRLYGSKARKAGALISGNMSKGYDFAKTGLGNLKTLAENSKALRYTTYGGMAGGGLYGSNKLADSIFGTQNLDQEAEANASANSNSGSTTSGNVNTSTNDNTDQAGFLENLKNSTKDVFNKGLTVVKDNPIASSLAALGIGGTGLALYLRRKAKKKEKKVEND